MQRRVTLAFMLGTPILVFISNFNDFRAQNIHVNTRNAQTTLFSYADVTAELLDWG